MPELVLTPSIARAPRSVRLAATLAALACAAGCVTSERPGRFQHYETLLQIVSDVQRHASDDLYRFPPPTDPSGQNLYKATLLRLANYAKMYPARFPDEVVFCRARAYERLFQYAPAALLYRRVAASDQADPALRARAERNADTLRRFLSVRPPVFENDKTAENHLEALNAWVDSWKAVRGMTRGTAYQCLAEVELEYAEEERLVFVSRFHGQLPGGVALATRLAEDMVAVHIESQRIGDHLLTVGDLYFALAKDYARTHGPTSGRFDRRVFEQFAEAAIQVYSGIANMDGAPQKPEGQGKLLAAEAFARRVRDLTQ